MALMAPCYSSRGGAGQASSAVPGRLRWPFVDGHTGRGCRGNRAAARRRGCRPRRAGTREWSARAGCRASSPRRWPAALRRRPRSSGAGSRRRPGSWRRRACASGCPTRPCCAPTRMVATPCWPRYVSSSCSWMVRNRSSGHRVQVAVEAVDDDDLRAVVARPPRGCAWTNSPGESSAGSTCCIVDPSRRRCALRGRCPARAHRGSSVAAALVEDEHRRALARARPPPWRTARPASTCRCRPRRRSACSCPLRCRRRAARPARARRWPAGAGCRTRADARRRPGAGRRARPPRSMT